MIADVEHIAELADAVIQEFTQGNAERDPFGSISILIAEVRRLRGALTAAEAELAAIKDEPSYVRQLIAERDAAEACIERVNDVLVNNPRLTAHLLAKEIRAALTVSVPEEGA